MRRFLRLLPPVRGAVAGGGLARAARSGATRRSARALTETPALDLVRPAWHEPPHAEIVNAATFALRRARQRLSGRRGGRARARRSPRATASSRRRSCPATAPASCCAPRCGRCWRARRRRGRDRVAGLGPAAAARARGRRAPGAGAARPRRRRRRRRARRRGAAPRRARSRCARPTTRRAATLAAPRCAGSRAALPARRLDPARRRAGRLRGAGRATSPRSPGELERLLVVRSFSKAHAMAGLPRRLRDRPEAARAAGAARARARRLARPPRPGWRGRSPTAERDLPRRRALAAAEREHLAAALAGHRPRLPARHRARCCGSRRRRGRPGARRGARREADLRRARHGSGATTATCAWRCAAPRRPTGWSRRSRADAPAEREPRCSRALSACAATRNAPRMNGCTRQKYV